MSSLTLFRHRRSDVPRIIARDAKRVRQHAAVVLEVLPDGVREHFNPKPSLNILAVIGPGRFGPTQFPHAVLLEVGLGRGIPYHEARNGRWHDARYPLCQLSRESYAQLSGRIFQILQQLTNERVAGWKCGPDNPFILPTMRAYFTQRGGLTLGYNGKSTYLAVPRGARFSVARRDEHILADVYWLQFNGQDRHLRFARFIDKLMSQYRGVRGFTKRKHVRWLIEELKARCPKDSHRTWQPYLLVELVTAHNHGGKRLRPIRFQPHLAEVIADITGWEGGETPEQRLARAVCVHPKERLAGLQLRDISGLRPQDAAKDHVVFEMFPEGRKEAFIA